MHMNRVNFYIAWFMSAEILPSIVRHRGGDFFFFFCPYVAQAHLSQPAWGVRRSSRFRE